MFSIQKVAPEVPDKHLKAIPKVEFYHLPEYESKQLRSEVEAQRKFT